MFHQRRLCMIEMPDIVLGRIFGATSVKQVPHLLLDRQTIMSLRHYIILVEHVAEEVAIVELVQKFRFDLRRQVLVPLLVVAAQRHIEGDNVLDLALVDRAITDCGAGGGKAMKKRLVTFGLRAGEEIAAWTERSTSGIGLLPRRRHRPFGG